ncbi:MAG: protein-disulfide reductase DsbD domain-containing protein, partial [Thermoanaerobaculia bacterium]
VLTSWNALAVSALVHASKNLGDPALIEAARRIAAFLLEKHVSGARVLHVSRNGAAKIGGFLEDYAFLARALLDLSEATGDPALASRAREIAGEMISEFSDGKAGGFFQTSASGKRGLLDSSKEFLDQVVPSPNGVAVEVLRRLDATRASPEFRIAADRAFSAAAAYARSFPTSATTFAMLAAKTPSLAAPHPSEDRAGPVRASLVVAPKGARPGEKTLLSVRIEVEPGWHIQSHLPSHPDLLAKEVRAAGDAIEFGEPLYPDGKDVAVAGEPLSTYSGAFEIPLPATISTQAQPGKIRARVTIEFQACDDRRCLAPSRLELSASLEVSR